MLKGVEPKLRNNKALSRMCKKAQGTWQTTLILDAVVVGK